MPLPEIAFTAAEAYLLLELSSPTVIDKWNRRGKIRAVGTDVHGAKLYLWADLVAARLTRRNARIAPTLAL